MPLTQKEHSTVTLVVFLTIATGLVLAVFLPGFLERDITFKLRSARGAGECLTVVGCADGQCGLTMSECTALAGHDQVFSYNQRSGLYSPSNGVMLREDLQGNALMVTMDPPNTGVVMMEATTAGYPQGFAFWYMRGRVAPVPFLNTFQGQEVELVGADVTGAYLVHADTTGTVSWAAGTSALQAPLASLFYQDFNVTSQSFVGVHPIT